jgi:hypothetical protein
MENDNYPVVTGATGIICLKETYTFNQHFHYLIYIFVAASQKTAPVYTSFINKSKM